jgi:SAM-dependent methyltransferase
MNAMSAGSAGRSLISRCSLPGWRRTCARAGDLASPPVTDPTRRFSNRVEYYVRYRPTYPTAVLDLLKAECDLTSASVVADVGSGTGILSELFLKNGNRVFGVEPNCQMREAAELLLAGYPGFTSVSGKAEATTLDDKSVDFVTAGQALHWFDPAAARAEFARIARPQGRAMLVWNAHRNDATPFLAAYARLLGEHGTDYAEVGRHEGGAGVVAEFFGDEAFETRTFDNRQILDLDGLKGRLSSSSYVPAPGQPGYGAMMRDAERIFRAHERNGRVILEYDTKVYYGPLR